MCEQKRLACASLLTAAPSALAADALWRAHLHRPLLNESLQPLTAMQIAARASNVHDGKQLALICRQVLPPPLTRPAWHRRREQLKAEPRPAHDRVDTAAIPHPAAARSVPRGALHSSASRPCARPSAWLLPCRPVQLAAAAPARPPHTSSRSGRRGCRRPAGGGRQRRPALDVLASGRAALSPAGSPAAALWIRSCGATCRLRRSGLLRHPRRHRRRRRLGPRCVGSGGGVQLCASRLFYAPCCSA